MSVKERAENVKECEEKLAKLQEEEVGLTEKKTELIAERKRAVRGLAGGDEKQRKVIVDLDARILPLSQKGEGLALLQDEARDALSKAEAGLKEAEDAQQQAIAEFLKGKTAEHKEMVRASLPKLVTEICDLLQKAEIKLGELNVGSFELGGWPGDDLYGFQKSFADFVERSALRPLISSGYPGSLNLWPMIENGPDIPVEYSGKGSLSAKAVCDFRAEKRVGQWTEEFQKGV